MQFNDLATARKNFQTKLRFRGPAPQEFGPLELPPDVRAVEYQSGELKLKAWISTHPADGKRRPAVVYLHGGWAFDETDWKDAAPFVNAGFVVLAPSLRAENGNPGVFEGFLGEVDDAIAAGNYLASLPFVDPNNVFVAGHSIGAILATLTAMMPSPFRAAAAFSGWVDMTSWVAEEEDDKIPFDRSNEREIQVRDPITFAASLRCPLYLYVEHEYRQTNERLLEATQKARRDCEMRIIPGDHRTMVAPAVLDAIKQFRQRMRENG